MVESLRQCDRVKKVPKKGQKKRDPKRSNRKGA